MKNRNQDHKDHWATPKSFYNELNEEFHFDFDPCPFNHDITKWDGLTVDWGKINFVNPPYSLKLKNQFVLRAIEEYHKGNICVLLLPVSTSTKLFHEHILPLKPEIRFIKGRLKFAGYNTKGEFVDNKPGMHDSMIVILDGRWPKTLT
jgi:site-specific DNA-methyltransferase (adenine-specific)